MGGSILVISGPSGSGKSSLLHRLLELGDDLYFSISTTTRMARKDEVAGVNYHYITKDMFEKDIKDGAFLEWAKVHDNYYGTSLKPILKALKDKKIVIFDIDVQGHRIVREKFGRLTTSVFITTSDKATLQKRLYARGADEPEVIERRLSNAVTEMRCMYDYDYLLVNDDLEATLKDLQCIVNLSRHKISCFDTKSFISEWSNIE